MNVEASGPLHDLEARRAAATDLTHNLVVVAGAGTGKTSLLVERALVAIGSGAVSIERLAAITFTEKAAGEMRARLALGLERLRRLASGEGGPAEDREADRVFHHLVSEEGRSADAIAGAALRTLERLDRAKVLTIHAFCSELLREHPLEARVAPDFRIDRGERAQTHFDEEWEAFVTEELGPRARRKDVWRRALSRLRLRDIRAAARVLADFKVPAEALDPAPTREEIQSALKEEAIRLAEAVASIQERQQGLSPLPSSFLRAAETALTSLARDGSHALKHCIAAEATLRRDSAPDPNRLLRGASVEEYKRIAREAFDLIQAIDGAADPLIHDLLAAVGPFARRFRESLLARGLVSFDALLSLARDLLRDHPEVREALKRRFQMLLVDEFQDTDPVQYEIVLFLAEKADAAAADAYATELMPGKLFVVGDPKQSIYRFRGADYTAFKQAVERIAPAEEQRLHLVSSFRSIPAVLDPVNTLFAAPATWSDSLYQPPYEAVRPTKRDRPDLSPCVEIWSVVPPGARARREAEGAAIAAEIERLVRTEDYGYGEFFVLLRAFTELPLYLRPLRARGIPFVVDGGREFLERTEVVHLLAALRALAQPADPVALLAFLRSPAAGVPDTELADYGVAGGSWRWTETPDPAIFPTLARAFSLLRRLHDETRDLPVDSLVRHVLVATHLLPLAAFAYEGAQRVANLRKLVMSAAELARDGSLTFNETLDAIETASAAEVEGDSPLADEGTQAVRVLTIHKAKGLESRVVFLPDLAREENPFVLRGPAEAALARLPSGDVALGLRVGEFKNAGWIWRERDGRRHEEAEATRLLYVALTRAKEKLVLVAGKPRRNKAPWIDALRAWGYEAASPPTDGARLCDGLVLHRRIGTIAPSPALVHESPEEADAAVARYEHAIEVLHACPPDFDLPSGLREERELRWDRSETGLPAVPTSAARSVARAVGSAIHRLLEGWDRRPEADALAALSEAARAAAREERVDPGEVEEQARAIMEAFLRSPLPARFREVRVLGREIPVLHRDARGVTWRGSIDLLYDDGGALVVADYKTDLDADGAVERYRGQLAVYVAAVERAMSSSRPVRAELWMLRRGAILSVDVGAGAC